LKLPDISTLNLMPCFLSYHFRTVAIKLKKEY